MCRQNQKKTSNKAILDKTITSHQILLESSDSDVFFKVVPLKGVFGFGGIWFILWRIDYFNFAIVFGTYLATFSLKKIKNMNPHKNNHKQIKIIKKLLLKKNMSNFTQFFLHRNGWLNTFFHQFMNIPRLQFFCFCL